MQRKMARSDPRASVRVTEVQVAGQHLASVCMRAGKTRTVMPVWDSSGEYRFRCRAPNRGPLRAKGLSSVEIPGLKNPIWLRPRTSDVETLIQVFALAEYDVFGTRQYAWLSNRYEEIVSGGGRPLIIDCGANIGLSAIWFLSRYPKAEIVAVEPDDGNLAIMRRNLAHYPNVRIVQGAPGRTLNSSVLPKTCSFSCIGSAVSARWRPPC